MKTNSVLFVFILLLLPLSFSLQVVPQQLLIENQTQFFEVYSTDPLFLETNCDEWFTFNQSHVLFEQTQEDYAYCAVYLVSQNGVESVKLSVIFSEDIQFGLVSNETTEYIPNLTIANTTSGAELVVVEENVTSPSGFFTGGFDMPRLNITTIGGVFIALFFATIVFFLVPK